MAIIIEDKDWNRMYDLIVDGKDGAGVARSIKQKWKAVARYVAAMRLLSMSPTNTFVNDHFEGHFNDFGNKALELGATFEDIYDTYSTCPVPTDLIEKIKDYLTTVEDRAGIPDNFFKELRHAGVPIVTSTVSKTSNQQKLSIRFYPDTYDECSITISSSSTKGNSPNEYSLIDESGLSTGLTGHFGYNEMRNKVFEALSKTFSDVSFNK